LQNVLEGKTGGFQRPINDHQAKETESDAKVAVEKTREEKKNSIIKEIPPNFLEG